MFEINPPHIFSQSLLIFVIIIFVCVEGRDYINVHGLTNQWQTI